MPGTAKIPLSGKLGSGKYALVDESDLGLVSRLRWHLSDNGYAINRSYGKTIRMHRLIMGEPEYGVVDHLNNDRLDNRQLNLRICTQAENSRNRKNTKGYSWDRSKKKWIVRYKSAFHGRYETEEAAIAAFRRAKGGVPYQKSRRKYWHLPTGVTKQFGKYRVRVTKDRKRIWLGSYRTPEEAAKKLEEWRIGKLVGQR